MEPLVAFPLVLPMGWKNTPPIFCTATETVTDLANHRLRQNKATPNHHLATLDQQMDKKKDNIAHIPCTTSPNAPIALPTQDPCLPVFTEPQSYIHVFVDDFIGLSLGLQYRNYTRNVIMNSIDDVFRPLEKQGHMFRQEPIFVKKFKKATAPVIHKKTILGWDINTQNQTINLPPHR